MLFLFNFTLVFLHIMWATRVILMLMFGWVAVSAAGIAYLEKISFGDALYFSSTSITVLTIGYGDIVVTTAAGRVIAIMTGFMGVLFTGLVVAGAVESVRKALHLTRHNNGANGHVSPCTTLPSREHS